MWGKKRCHETCQTHQLRAKRTFLFLIFHLEELCSHLTEVNTCYEAPCWADGGREYQHPSVYPSVSLCL